MAIALVVLPPLHELASAQEEGGNRAFPTLNGLEDLLGDASKVSTGSPIKTTARVMAYEGNNQGWLQIAAEMKPGWHVYSITQPAGGPKTTRIVLEPSTEYELAGEFQADKPPIVKPADIFPVPEEYHEGRVVWTARILFGEGVDPTQVQASGHLSGQMCEDGGGCLPIGAKDTAFQASFSGTVASPPSDLTNDVTSDQDAQAHVAPAPISPTQNVPIEATLDHESSQLATQSSVGTTKANAPSPATGSASLVETVRFMGIALLGGLLLNLMPCVLPVIGLKVMSFAQQAGEDPRRVLWLNVWFVAGILAVFMVLAALAAFLGMRWGEQFQLPEFNIAMVSIVFVFALSFLGVWEVPIPGFVGSGKAVDLAEREGVAGAFFKGLLTTLLATPCVGPFIIPALTWSLRQPKPLIFVTFACMGLGMGLPYLLFGMSPPLMRLLPKPGAWMDTFKQLMGFVMLATVVWLFNSLNSDYFVPTLALMFTLWAACWWVGRTPITAPFGERLRSYAAAGVFALVLGMFSFRILMPSGLDWDAFTRAALREHQNNGVTVFVDFTADWCPTCKTNEALAIKTDATKEFLAEHGIVPLIADITEDNAEAESMLDELGNPAHGIPYYAIFPGDGRPPISFTEFPLTQASLLKKLRAGLPMQQLSSDQAAQPRMR